MRIHRCRGLFATMFLAWTFALLGACASSAGNSGPQSVPTQAVTEPASTAPPSASSGANAPESPEPPAASAPAAPRALEPATSVSERAASTLLESVFGTSDFRAWRAGGDLFVLAVGGGPADQHRDVVPYPANAAEAAMGGRVVAVASIWRVERERLTRVLGRPVRLQPMVCEDEPCGIVELAYELHADGRFELGPGDCAAAMERLPTRSSGNASIDAFDRAVIPALCRGVGVYGWDGRGYTIRRGAPPQPADQAAFVDPAGRASAVLSRLFEPSLSPDPRQVWSASTGAPTFALFVHSYPAPSNPFVPHRPGTELWASGRSVQVAEVWAARAGVIRRVFRQLTGLATLAEPNVVLSVGVSVAGDELVVGDPEAPCAADRALAPDEAGAALDREMARAICAGRGSYRWNGRRFGRRSHAAPAPRTTGYSL